jgi:hypothetical protein
MPGRDAGPDRVGGFGLTGLSQPAIRISMTTAEPIVQVEQQIHLIRGQKVMLDRDLAALYGVPTFRLNEAVQRNRGRFPEDFAFLLTREEVASLRSQIAMLEKGRGKHSKYTPYVFTEHGVVMLCSVLRSERAVRMNIAVVRAFVRLRELIASNKDLAVRIEKLEAGQGQHASVINLLVEEIQSIKALPEPSKKRIGFHAGED